MINKMDRTITPSKETLIDYVEGDLNNILKSLCNIIENDYKAKSQIDFSTCSGAPGWNLKYKKSGKSICTIYPEKHDFIMLITLNSDALEIFKILSNNFSPYIRDLVEKSGGINNAKWLMIQVKDQLIAEDVKKLLELKFSKNIK